MTNSVQSSLPRLPIAPQNAVLLRKQGEWLNESPEYFLAPKGHAGSTDSVAAVPVTLVQQDKKGNWTIAGNGNRPTRLDVIG